MRAPRVSTDRIALCFAGAAALLAVYRLSGGSLADRLGLPLLVLIGVVIGYLASPESRRSLGRRIERWGNGDPHRDAELLAKQHARDPQRSVH